MAVVVDFPAVGPADGGVGVVIRLHWTDLALAGQAQC